MAFNSSLRRLTFENNSLSQNNSYRSRNAMGRRDLDLSLTLAPHELQDLDVTHVRHNDTTLRHVLDETQAVGSHRKGPQLSSELSEMFYEVLQTSQDSDPQDRIGRFIQACCDSLERVEASQRCVAGLGWLHEEAGSWRLLYALLQDRLVQQAPPQPSQLTQLQALSQRELVAALFREDAALRLMQVIADWLESCAAHKDAMLGGPGAAAWGGAQQHWENTLHHLERGTSLFDSRGSVPSITQLDPDAPRREMRQLHALDMQDDVQLCQRIFKELRCGRFEEAVSMCVCRGQMWRALLLQGQRLLHYPHEPQHDSQLPMEGNPNRDLWKWCCLELLTQPDENVHMKAALGVLCGHLPAVLPLCGDIWEDLLWAHLRTQIELQVDQHLRENISTAGAYTHDPELQELMSQFPRPVELSLPQIFANVNALHKNTPETPHQETQRLLILRHLGGLYRQASTWLSSGDNNLIRFLAHLVILLRQIGDDPSPEVGDDIIQAYVEHLIETSDGTTITPQLISHYVSALPVPRQIEKFSELMWAVEALEDRQRVMEAGSRAGLDVRAAARHTGRRAVALLRETLSRGDPRQDDQQVILQVGSCLQWFSFSPDQVPEAVQMSNAIIRTLIFKGDVDSATGVLASLTKFCPTGLITQSLASASKALGEHLCLKAYLEAINGYAAWYRQHAGGRPRSPDPLAADATFTDKVHHEQIRAQILVQQERWSAAGSHRAKHIKQLLYNVLLFPRGWLVDDVVPEVDPEINEAEDPADREKQLVALRKLCIPEIVMLLLKVLQSGGTEGNVEAVRLAEILAAERHQLYKLFSKPKLREVLHMIGESSLTVVDDNLDPWGFKPSN